MAETLAESCKLLPIDKTVTIQIKLVETIFNLAFFLYLIKVLHGSNTTHELFGILIVVERKESWQLIDQFLIKLSL